MKTVGTGQTQPLTFDLKLYKEPLERFTLASMLVAIIVGVGEIAFGLIWANQVTLVLGPATLLGIALPCYLANWLVRRGHLLVGVYTSSIGAFVTLALVPLLATGLLPITLLTFVAAMLLVALLLSPRHVWRIALFSAILMIVATWLEHWQPPWPRAHLIDEVVFVPIVIDMAGIVAVAFLITFMGETILRSISSAQAYAGQLEQSQAELEERSASLEKRNVEQQQLVQELQATSQQAEHRAAQLATSSQVARAISQVRDPDQLLAQVTQLISEAFGYYHVGIFIVDEIGRFAVLSAANSEGGQRMLARSHKLAVGEQGLVGYVTGSGQPRIALDVGVDAVHFTNPDLPQTRSELGLPLQIGSEIIGAMDVQSTQEAAFTEEDITVLGGLANQIAVAIQNARLFAQSQASLQDLEETQRRYVRQQWEELLTEVQSASFEYHTSGTPSVGDSPLPEMTQAILHGKAVTSQGSSNLPARATLAVPIKLLDQTIGVIDLHEIDAERTWTNEEMAIVSAVADQAALALENARLFAQTQQRAQREQLIARISARMRDAPDVEGVLRTAVQEIRRALGVSHGAIRLGMADQIETPDRESREQIERAE
ncbi:MAG: GAF domain-containing protein [Thermoflexales bacterium]|nr:GAF domain-containing protein [Thermoflexales bacterium]